MNSYKWEKTSPQSGLRQDKDVFTALDEAYRSFLESCNRKPMKSAAVLISFVAVEDTGDSTSSYSTAHSCVSFMLPSAIASNI